MRNVVMTQITMRSRVGPEAIRIAFVEPYALLDRHGGRSLREPAVVALFAGAETVRRWRPSERFVGDAAEWRCRKDAVLADLLDGWEAIHVRHDACASWRSLATALGCEPSVVLGPGFEDALEALASGPPSPDEADHYWRSSLRHGLDRAYGATARGAKLALQACSDPPGPFATVPPVLEPAGPHAPIHVSTHAVDVTVGRQRLRYAVVENEGRLFPDGRWRVGGAVVGLRRHDGFNRFTLAVTEEPRDEWEARKARQLARWKDWSPSGVVATTTTFPTRAAFVDAVGPRFLRAIGGRKTLDALAPVEARRDVLRLREAPSRRAVADAASAPGPGESDDPLFGAF